jgi:uncharacterized protein (TIGR03437 family)
MFVRACLLRGRTQSALNFGRNVSALVGPLAAEVLFVGPQPQFPGLDQVNLRIKDPVGLTGLQRVKLRVDGAFSNSVDLQFR